MGHGDAFFLGQVEIADDPVGPQVDDVDLQRIARRTDDVGDIDAPGRRPQNAQRSAVQPDFGDGLHSAKIEEQAAPGTPGRGRLQIERFSIGGLSGIILDAVFASPRPAYELREFCRFRPAPARIESDLPSAGDFLDGNKPGEIPRRRSRGPGSSRFLENDEQGLHRRELQGNDGAAVIPAEFACVADLPADRVPDLRALPGDAKSALRRERTTTPVGYEINFRVL